MISAFPFLLPEGNKRRIIWPDKREPNAPFASLCFNYGSRFLHKGALELNKIKDIHHTWFMAHWLCSCSQSCSLRSWLCMYDNKCHICALHKKLSFLVTLSSVFLLKTIMLSCSKIIFQSANDNTGLTRSGVFTFACVCVHPYERMQPFWARPHMSSLSVERCEGSAEQCRREMHSIMCCLVSC